MNCTFLLIKNDEIKRSMAKNIECVKFYSKVQSLITRNDHYVELVC